MIIRFLLVKFEIVYSLCNFFGYYSVIRLISSGGLQSNFISCFRNWNTSWIRHYCISQYFAKVKKKKKKRDPRGQHKINDYIIRWFGFINWVDNVTCWQRTNARNFSWLQNKSSCFSEVYSILSFEEISTKYC